MSCTVGCEPVCQECGRVKAPWGRDVAPAMYGSRCERDCPGYDEKPYACSMWPGETRRDMLRREGPWA